MEHKYPKGGAVNIRPDYYKNNGRDLFDHFAEIMPTQGFQGLDQAIHGYARDYPLCQR
ncbi:Hypothetical protein SAC12_1418 [Levilactobacillus brevis]|nr:Hypothetical protein SAC12_1418 [Levilactobacillus brevis]